MVNIKLMGTKVLKVEHHKFKKWTPKKLYSWAPNIVKFIP